MEEHEFLDGKGGNMECPGQWMKKDLQKDIKFWSFRIEIEDKFQKTSQEKNQVTLEGSESE